MSDGLFSSGQEVVVQAGRTPLEGNLMVPDRAGGMVIFAHGSGSSRFSTRNRFVARTLNQAGLGTLLFDLLTSHEHGLDAFTRRFRFDIVLLTERLVGAMDWVRRQPLTRHLALGLFGASTGAAAALAAATERADEVAAVVSRSGRPDLAGLETLGRVQAPVLLIVGGDDPQVIDMNRQASEALRAHCHLEIVPGAGHLFEEPGTLERAAGLARDWFLEYLPAWRRA